MLGYVVDCAATVARCTSPGARYPDRLRARIEGALVGNIVVESPEIVELTATGQPDATFAGGGSILVARGVDGVVHNLAFDPSGRIVAAGSYPNSNYDTFALLERIGKNGSP